MLAVIADEPAPAGQAMMRTRRRIMFRKYRSAHRSRSPRAPPRGRGLPAEPDVAEVIVPVAIQSSDPCVTAPPERMIWRRHRSYRITPRLRESRSGCRIARHQRHPHRRDLSSVAWPVRRSWQAACPPRQRYGPGAAPRTRFTCSATLTRFGIATEAMSTPARTRL